MSLSVVILAAGKGTRMKSALPKVLHSLANKPLVGHVIDTARQLSAQSICLVYGHGGEQVKAQIDAPDLAWVEQAQQLGTGHAVQQALPVLPATGPVLVLYGDVPLISTETLSRLLAAQPAQGIGLLTIKLDNPTGYGRIVRDAQNQVQAIVEQKDANPEQLAITEVNTGILVVNTEDLRQWLAKLTNQNAQGEYYLTDLIALARADGRAVQAVSAANRFEVEGVNDRLQLAQLERAFQWQQAERLMRAGVTLRDPARIDIRGQFEAGADSIIDINLLVEGKVSIGRNCRIGPNCVLKDCVLGDDVEIRAFSHIDGASIGQGSQIGPYARLRPGSELAADTHVGNFVELKNVKLGAGSKANHLTYLGDAEIGARVNVGAGVITCNYDGANKFKTLIGNDVFVGSDSQLVAPVSLADGVTVGAGTTVTQDVPAGLLVVGRVRQRHVEGWVRPVKKK